MIGDNDGEAVTTPYDNCVLVMPSVRQARAGVTEGEAVIVHASDKIVDGGRVTPRAGR